MPRFAPFAPWARLFAMLAMAAALAAVPAVAQQKASLQAQLEGHKTALDQAEAALSRENVGNDALNDLRDRLLPLRERLRALVEEIEPKAAEFDTRLKQLGPPPEEDAPPEDGALAQQRKELGHLFGETDAAVKQAKLLALRADQIGERISARRRAIFTRELLHRSASILNPAFWSQVADAVRYEWRSLRYALESWRDQAAAQGGLGGFIGAILTLSLLAAGAAAFSSLFRRRLGAPRTFEGRFAKSAHALLVVLRAMLGAPLASAACVLALDAFRLLPDRVEAIGWGLVVGVAVASFGRGAAVGLFAPDAPVRRLPPLDDAAARTLSAHMTFMLRVFGAVVFLNTIHKELYAPVALTVVTSAVLALAVAATVLHTLLRLERSLADPDHPSRAQSVRVLALGLALGIVVLSAAGYVGLASFVAGRLLTLVVIGAACWLLLALVDSVFAEVLVSDTVTGRTAAALLGLKPRSVDVIGMLLSGVLRAGLVGAAALLVAGPWGFFAADFFGALEGAVFGFKIGEITISLSAIFGALAVLLIGLALTRALQRWLQTQFLPRTGIEASLQLSIATIVGYVGFIAAVALALSELGVDLQKIAIVAGALSVGIGFGLQSIVSNFVSGLILLAERPIRVGDSIVVKGEEGYVRRISVRATEIETFERASVIVPNSELITGVVKNWTHANTTGRIIVKVGVAYDCDPEQVRDILLAVAGDHPQVLQTPPPRVFLVSFGDSALEFELRCVVANVDYGLSIKSDLHFAILSRFRAARIEIPYPQRELRVVQEGRAPTALVPLKTQRSAEG